MDESAMDSYAAFGPTMPQPQPDAEPDSFNADTFMDESAMNSYAAFGPTIPQPQPDAEPDSLNADTFMDDAALQLPAEHYDLNGFGMNDPMYSWHMPPPPTPLPQSQAIQPTSTTKKPPNPRFTAAEWEEQKPTICRLYREEGETLVDVREFLANSGFDATLRQLKRKIKDWKLEKYVKTGQMMAIARTRAKRMREGRRESAIRTRKESGVLADNAKVDRFLKRKKLSTNMLISEPSPVNASSPAFSVYTPHPSTPGPSTPNVVNSGQMMPPPSPAPENGVSYSHSVYTAPSPTPSFSWIHRSSTPFTGQSPAPFAPESTEDETIQIPDSSPSLGDSLQRTDQSSTRSSSETDDVIDLDGFSQLEQGMGQAPIDPPPPSHGKRCFQDREDKWRDELARLESIHGVEHHQTFNASLKLGIVLGNQGRYKSAENHLRRLAVVSRSHLGKDDLFILGELANTYYRQGRYRAAEKLYQQILKLLTATDPNLHSVQALKLKSRLAAVYLNDGRYQEASALYNKVLELKRKIYGPEHAETLISMSSLADSFALQGSLTKAAQMLRHILSTQTKVSGADSLEVVHTTLNLAVSLSLEGLHDESEQLSQAAYDTRKKILGREHPLTLSAECSLGCRILEQGRFSEAETILRRGWIASKKVLGSVHPRTLEVEFELGLSILKQKRLEEAGSIFKDVADSRRRILGDDHPKTLEAMLRIAAVKIIQKDYANAEVWYKEALTRRRVVDTMHPDTFESEMSLALTVNAQGRHDEAEEIILDSMARSKKALGEEHRRTLVGIWCFGRIRSDQGRLHEARELYQDALEKMQKFLGFGHVDTVECARSLRDIEDYLARKSVEEVVE